MPEHVDDRPRRSEADPGTFSEAYVSATLAAILDMGERCGPETFRAYLDGLVRDAGDPTDPLTKMLLEQAVLLHLRLIQLHGQAASAESAETIKVLNAACARLTGELRRTVESASEMRRDRPRQLRVRKAGAA